MAQWTIEGPRRLSFEEPVERLQVRLISGRLNVVGTDGPARVEVSSIGTRPLEVALENGALSVNFQEWSTSWRWLGPIWSLLSGRKAFNADVSIAVPHHTHASLHLTSGSLVASALRAGAEVEVTSGRVTLLGLAGRVQAKMISGPVEALGVGGEVSLETISGELVVADSTAERVLAKTVSGAITVDLDNPPYHTQISLETISGEVTVRVREDSDLDVRLFAVSGRVTSAFPQLRNDSSPGRKNSAHGVLGSGAGRLSANTASGNISLLSRPVDEEEAYGYPEDAPAAGQAEQGATGGDAPGTEPR
jgi:putative adhesin